MPLGITAKIRNPSDRLGTNNGTDTIDATKSINVTVTIRPYKTVSGL